MPIIPALGRLKQEYCEFKAILGYSRLGPYPLINPQNKKENLH
jgi:hypothetical protein